VHLSLNTSNTSLAVGKPGPFIRILLPCILMSTLLWGCQPAEKSPVPSQMPVHVEVAQVKVAPLDQVLTAVGSLSSPQETVVAPQITGKIVELNIKQGEVVKRGTVLVRLDDAIQKATVLSAEAAVANARQIYARDQEVLGTGAVSEQKLQSDQASLQQAEAQLQQARANLEYTSIPAPFTGLLGFRKVSLGAYLKEGDAIVNIRQIDPLYLDFDLPQQAVRHLRVGQVATFTVPGLTGTFQGRVTTLDSALTAASRTVHVQSTVPNPTRRLKPGMFVLVRLVIGTIPKALFVPMQALVPQGQVRHVWVVGSENRAERKTVEVGLYQDNWAQILKGLAPSDRVVTAGVQKIYPNAKLITSPYQPIHNPRLDLTNPEGKMAP
jgi:membrane fusion protein (multidrug efflux system)